VLTGFSRGAFTARSVAGFISSIGLLTHEGMDMFYAIFTDSKNWHRDSYRDPFPQVPFPNKPRGAGAAQEYARNLQQVRGGGNTEFWGCRPWLVSSGVSGPRLPLTRTC
jgi:hypothetical protein